MSSIINTFYQSEHTLKFLAGLAILDAVFLCVTGCDESWGLFAVGVIVEIGLAYGAYKYKTQEAEGSDKRRSPDVQPEPGQGSYVSVGVPKIVGRKETQGPKTLASVSGKGILKVPASDLGILQQNSLTREGAAFQSGNDDL